MCTNALLLKGRQYGHGSDTHYLMCVLVRIENTRLGTDTVSNDVRLACRHQIKGGNITLTLSEIVQNQVFLTPGFILIPERFSGNMFCLRVFRFTCRANNHFHRGFITLLVGI